MNNSIDVFFYGLFMDPAALRAQGLDPRGLRKARVSDMALQLGNRATLVRQVGAAAHGIIMTLTKAELELLYSDPSVAAYRPEPVTAECADGTTVEALCYNLQFPDRAGANPDYAIKLRIVARRMGLPAQYIASIR
jgi:hypothetical protein